jgi:N-methylhydantoinase B
MTEFATDRLTLEVLKNHFTAIAEAMGHTVERTAYSTFVKESADFVTALATPTGEVFAYPRDLGVSSFLGLSLSPVLDRFPTPLPGDIIVTNDPYATLGLATHLPDVHLLKPIFNGDQILCWAWCFVHCSDVGGLTPASISPTAEDIQQEGLRIPPQKLYRAGQLNDDLAELMLVNCRSPAENWGDISAMIGALNTAEARIADLLGRWAPQTVSTAAEDMLTWSEIGVRNQLRQIPDGSYEFTDYLDDGLDGVPVRIVVTLHVQNDEVLVDYSGTDPQVAGAFNVPGFGDRHPFLAQGLINYALTQDPSIPLTGGVMRPVRTKAPVGSLLNPLFPAAVGTRYATVVRLYNVVLGALAQAVPKRIPAAGSGAAAVVMLSVPHLDSGTRQVAVLEPLQGGGGAADSADGVSGNDSAVGFLRNTPVESIEVNIPVVVERYELAPDSAGAGRRRGGWGTRFDFRVLRPGSIVTARGMERCRFEPWGLAGGRAAGRTTAILNYGSDRQRNLGRIDILRLEPGDTVGFWCSGGGGYGDPLDRDPQSVAEDFHSGLLSLSAALKQYGVIIRDGGPDIGQTAALRDSLRADIASLSEIDFGPERAAYEAIWNRETSAALSALLYSLPVSLRVFAKRAIHHEAERQQPDSPLSAEVVGRSWATIRAGLPT